MSDGDATEAATGSRKTKRWQKVVSVVLLVIGFILVPISAVAIWSHNQLLVLWDRPGIGTVVFIAVVALIVVGFIEFLARGATSESAQEHTGV